MVMLGVCCVVVVGGRLWLAGAGGCGVSARAGRQVKLLKGFRSVQSSGQGVCGGGRTTPCGCELVCGGRDNN